MDLNHHLKDLQSRTLTVLLRLLIGSGGWSRTNSLVIQSHLRYQLRHSRMNWSLMIESNYRIRLHKPAFYH